MEQELRKIKKLYGFILKQAITQLVFSLSTSPSFDLSSQKTYNKPFLKYMFFEKSSEFDSYIYDDCNFKSLSNLQIWIPPHPAYNLPK